MKNENKVTIKNRKIMIHKISRYLLTLVALLAMTTGAWAEDGELLVTITPDASGNIVYSVPDIATLDKGDAEYSSSKGCWRKSGGDANLTVTVADGINVTKVKFTTNKNDSWEDMDAPYQVKLSSYYAYNASGGRIGTGDGIKKIEVYGTKAAGPVVEISTDQTEAEFAMPAYDATAEYELVRDMGYGVKALVNNGAERIYVTKVENKFVPKEAITYKLTDVLDQNNQLDLEEGTDYQKVGLHILDGATWKDVTDESDLKPGTYEMIFEGLGKYDGKVYSQEFLLSNGYELTIASGEYATFYHNEKVSIEDSDAEIYTIANVSTTEAVLSEKMTVAPSETPLLVYNAGTEKKTFLLMPTDDEASEALVAAEFRGTLAAKDMPASSTNMDYYVCTGKAFDWVRDAGQIAANRCWLQIGSGNQPASTRASSRAITRGFGGIDGTTGIDAIDNEQFANDTYYDLQGRKVQNPKRGGIYIHNGKKVIVR